MKLYKNTEGYEYTEDEVLAAAKESNMALEDYIVEFDITPVGQGEPGKKKPAAAKGAPAAGKAKDTASKPAATSLGSKKKLWKEEVQPQTQTDGTFVAKPKILKPKVIKEPTIKEKVEEGKQIMQEGKERTKPQRELKAKISLPSEEDILDISTNVQGTDYDKLAPEEKLYVDDKAVNILQNAYGKDSQYDLSPSEIELKSREILSKAKQTKKTIEEESYTSKLLNVDLLKGLNYLGEAFASVPETIYTIGAIPQNIYAAISGDKNWEASPEKFKKTFGVENPIMDKFIDEQERLGKMQTIYNNANYDSVSISENIADRNYVDAFKLMGSGLAESVPISIAMMAGGAELKLAELAAGSTVALAGPNIRQQEEENPEQSELTSVIKGFGMAGAESVFSAIGEGSLGKVYKDIVKKEGAEVGSKIFKDGLVTMYQSALKKFGAPAAMLGEGLEEVATTITQNMINNKNPFEGAMDSFILGAGGGGLYGSPLTIAKGIDGFKQGVVVHKINKQLKTENLENLVTAFKPEFQSSPAKIKAAIIPGSTKILDNQVDTSVNNGDMTVEEGDKIKLNFRQTQGIVNALQPLELSDEDLPAAVDLIKEKKQLEEVVKKVGDPSLTVEQGNRIKEINTALTGIGENNAKKKATENVSTLEGNIKALEKYANTLGQVEFENAVGEGKGVESFNTVDEFKTALETAGLDEAFVEEAMNADGFMLPNGQIVINKQVAAQSNLHTMGHELLHKILKSEFTDPAKATELKDQFLAQLTSEERALLDERILAVDKNGKRLYSDEDLAAAPDEYLTQYFQIIADKKIPWSEKLGDSLERLWKNFLGKIFKSKGYNKLEFADGKDIYRFINDYAKTIKSGKISQRAQDLAKAGISVQKPIAASKSIQEKMDALDEQLNNDEIDYDTYEVRMDALVKEEEKVLKANKEGKAAEAKPKEAKKETPEDEAKSVVANNKGLVASDKVQKIYDTEGVNGAQKIIDLFRPITSKIVDKRRDAPGFDKELLTDEIETGVGGILDLIQKYKPESGIPLAAYINKYLPVRAIATSRRILGETFSKDVEDQKGLTATETADQFTEIAMPDKPKYKTILESNVFDQEVIKSVTDKLKIVLRTLKSKINEPISKNTTVTPLVNEIRNEMGAQADIDIKKALGGKEGGVLKNNLIKNKKAILENMTTTWLMGKDTKSGVQGGVPSAIQKQINGKWVSYPDWVGQKIDREKTTTNLAGKTSGAEIVRRLPNAANNISNEEFLSWFLEPSGNPIRGRKESLSKALGEELSFDIFKKELEEGGEIAKVFERNQELKNVVLLDTYINEVAKQIDRGTVKFSKSTKSELEYNMKIADSQGGASLMDDIAVTQGDSEDDKRDRLIYEGAIAINDFKNTLKSPISSYKAEIKKANGEFNIQIFNNPKIPNYLKDEYLDKNRKVNKNDVAEIGDKLAKILPKEFLDAVGIQIFGYHNKLLDPAFEKGGKGGPRAEFYDRSQELKEAFDSNNVPNNTGVDFSKVRIMNINAPGGKNGLFRRIVDLQESNESDVNKKIEKLVELLPEIADANTENKKVAVLFTEKIGELLLDEKINFNAVADLLKAQTNFVMGLRALTNLSVVELRSGKQEEKKKGEHINPNVHKMTELVGLYAEALSSLSEGGLKSDILKKLNYELNLLFTDHSQALMNLADSKIMDNLGSPTSRDGFKRFNLIPEVKKYLYTPSGSLFNEIELTNQIENEKNAIRNLAKFSKIVSDGIQAETVRGLLNNNQLEELQKEIEANYSTKLKLGNESNDIRTSLFNYDDPIARKMSNGVDLRITEGLIRNNKKTYLLYADGKIVGQFETVNQAKDLIKYIEDNLIKPTAIEQSPIKFSLSSRRDLKWRQTDEALATNFKVGDIDYKIALIETAYMEYDEKTESILYDLADKNNLNEDILTAWEGEAYNLEFWDKKQGNGITGTGNAAEVFGIVINGVIDIANKKNIKSFIFTAKEQSRIKLYDAISSVVANKLDWNNYSKDGVYIISKEGKPNNGKVKFSKSLDKEFNIILAQNKGVSPAIKYSGITAKRQGSSKGKYKFFLPPGAEDFEGLLYNFIGKGKLGEEQAKFFEETLIDPYWNGISEIEAARQRIKKDFIALKEAFPGAAKKITKRIPSGDFTYDQAIRVYLWAKEGKKIPDLSKSDQTMLTRLVANDVELSTFANGLELISGRDGQWSDPSEYWDSETIVSELNDMTEKIGRKKYLEEFIKNSDEIFSKENLNKVEALYGEGVRDAIEDSLYRMTNGKNRSQGTGRFTAAVSTWLNGSVAEIMFLNTKSGILQLISALNYLNLRDNNPVMAGKALLDFPQFSKDFAKIFNSDMMKERRQGLKEDVSAAEIANAAATAKNKIRATVAYLAKIGFTPTTIADALAIGFGGATFYRNRINTYKKQGMPEEEAEAKAWKDFTRLTNKSAQSNDPALISQQQAEPIGRLILAFGNATLQMNRIMKKSAKDLINGRGNPSEHVAKILFYGFIQNALFSAMQKALFIGLFGGEDEEEDKKKKKTTEEKAFEMADDMLDSFLRGSGLAGAVVSTAKNTTQQYFKQREKKQKGDQAYTLIEGLNLSPSLGSKARKIYGAIQEEKFNRAVMEKMGGQLMLEGRFNPSPAYMVGAKVTSALTNLPADRLLDKVTNISEALDARNENWQRAMLMIGYKPFEIGVKNEEQEAVKAQAKIEREDEVFIQGVEKKKAQIKRIRSMSPEERRAYVDSIRATVPAKIERAKRRRKLLYGK